MAILQKGLVKGEDEVISRLSQYQGSAVTNLLYDFGSQILRERTERTNWIDTKAGMFAGYAGALVVIVISTFSTWKDVVKDWPAPAGCLFSGLSFLLLAAFFAILSLRARKRMYFSYANSVGVHSGESSAASGQR